MRIVPQFLRRKIEHRPNLTKIVDNVSWLLLDKILRMGIGLLVGVWIARYLGPEQFGLLSFATAFVGLFGAVAALGLQEIVVRDLVRDPAGKEETLGTAAVLHLLGGLLSYGLILATIFWLRPNDPLAKTIVAILGSLVLLKASEVAAYWFESQVMSKYIVWMQNGSFLSFAAIKVALILNQEPLIAFAWATAAEAALVALLIIFMLGFRGPRLRQLRFAQVRAKKLLKDSWPLLLSGVTIMIYMKIDQIMLGQMIGDEAVGIYSAAVRISEVWYFIPTMIVASVFPAILEARNRSEVLYKARLQQLYDLMVWLSVGVALPMTFLSTTVVTLLFGVSFAASGPILAVHLWASVFVFLGVASGKWLIAENRQILSLQRSAAGAVSNILLNAIFIPHLGAIGAAISTVISFSIAAFFYDSLQKETRPMFLMKIRSLNPFMAIPRLRRFMDAAQH